MANDRSPVMDDDGDDDFFREVYGKEYAGPPRLPAINSQDVQRESKRPVPAEDYDADGGAADPNAVPTDFTSREAKVWEARAKAVERNWNRRKEEESICKICGDSSHFTQGCPSTLGGGKKFGDFFERVAARDKRIRALFSDAVISRLEKEIGCKIRMDEKFLFVSGKDRLILAKGVDAVHKLIQEGRDDNDRGKSPPKSSQKSSRSKSPERSPSGRRSVGRGEAQIAYPTHRDPPEVFDQRKGFSSQERFVQDRAREGSNKFSRDNSPEARGKSGAKRRHDEPSHSDVGGNRAFTDNGYEAVPKRASRADRWDAERHSEKQQDYVMHPQSLEELEAEFRRETAEIQMQHKKEEEEENSRHQERLRKLREGYEEKMGAAKAAQTKKREEFLRAEAQRRLLGYQSQQMWYAANYGGSAGGRDARGAIYPTMDAREAYSELQHSRRAQQARGPAFGSSGGGGPVAALGGWGGPYAAAAAAAVAAISGAHDAYGSHQPSRRGNDAGSAGYDGGTVAAMDAAWGGVYAAAMAPHDGYPDFQQSRKGEDHQRGSDRFGAAGSGRY